MGCDIHAVIEYQEHDRWETFAKLEGEPRDYMLFGALTGGEVRGEAGPGLPLRGFPDDVGAWTGDDYYVEGFKSKGPDLDWHSPSWVTSAELTRALAWVAEQRSAPPTPYWNTVLVAMRSLDAAGTPSRLVFWFDN